MILNNLEIFKKLEKHYTTSELYNHMWDEILMKYNPNFLDFLETSAGDGRLIDFINSKGYDVKAYDIYNETDRDDIKQCDYLKTKLDYKKGRVTFMNPPFKYGLKFIYKALEETDYCISILSLNSFLNIDYDKYEVDTIDIFRDYDFGSCKVGICIVGIKKKIQYD